jgi:hypothetical protein
MVFVKGDSNINRKGRPKGFSIVAHLKETLQSVPQGQKESYAELITKKYLHKALVEGDTVILKDLINRVDGMPKETLNLHVGKLEEVLDEIEKKKKKG